MATHSAKRNEVGPFSFSSRRTVRGVQPTRVVVYRVLRLEPHRPRYPLASPSISYSLVASLDEVVGQGLDGGRCVAGLHALPVMADEDGLLRLHDDGALSAL